VPPTPHLSEKLVGTIAPLVGVIMSYFEQIEVWLRLASMFVGFTIGVITLYRLIRNNKG
jgi:hypothetical protein